MSTARKIKRRIRMAKNIARISRAMEMVAASKMKRAQTQAIASRPYAEKLNEVVANLLFQEEMSIKEKIIHPTSTKLYLIVAPDKGLCGGLVTNLAREVFKTISPDDQFVTVGKKAKDIILRLRGNIIADFPLGINQPTYSIVPPVITIIKEKFENRQVEKVLIIYSQFINTMVQKPTIKQLLPVTPPIEQKVFTGYLFEPSTEEILSAIFPHYLEMEVFQVLLEAFASEQSARMIAMKNATDNANNIVTESTLEYNKVRQQNITYEISDITTASMALKK